MARGLTYALGALFAVVLTTALVVQSGVMAPGREPVPITGTGNPVYKQFIGAGQAFDINWGSPAIARDGTVYLGIFKGIIAIADAHPATGGECRAER